MTCAFYAWLAAVVGVLLGFGLAVLFNIDR